MLSRRAFLVCKELGSSLNTRKINDRKQMFTLYKINSFFFSFLLLEGLVPAPEKGLETNRSNKQGQV